MLTCYGQVVCPARRGEDITHVAPPVALGELFVLSRGRQFEVEEGVEDGAVC